MADREPWPEAARVSDFASGRLENFVWSNCWRTGLSLTADLHDFGFHEVGCSHGEPSWRPVAPEFALLGTDGFQHLAHGRRLLCSRSRGHRAKVAPGATPTPLIEVPRRLQCLDARSGWPGLLDGTRLGGVRRQLVASFGPGCTTCDDPWAQIVDHDHLTGMVRGYLCRTCNGLVDRCLHLFGCEFAGYLGQPPASKLGLVYPRWKRQLKHPRYLARLRCFQIVMDGGTSPGHGIQPAKRDEDWFARVAELFTDP